jgi:hypothetical protein
MKRRSKIDFDFSDWWFGIDIKKLRKDLDALEKLGVDEVYMDPEQAKIEAIKFTTKK